MDKKNETYAKVEKDEFDNHLITIINGKEIKTLRITSTEHKRLMDRSTKEYTTQSNTWWNRISLAFKMLF